jgi:hypothetical protein
MDKFPNELPDLSSYRHEQKDALIRLLRLAHGNHFEGSRDKHFERPFCIRAYCIEHPAFDHDTGNRSKPITVAGMLWCVAGKKEGSGKQKYGISVCTIVRLLPAISCRPGYGNAPDSGCSISRRSRVQWRPRVRQHKLRRRRRR